MNYCHLLMAEVHCSMEILLLNNCGDEAEPTTPFCAFYKEGKGGTDVPVFMHRSGGVGLSHFNQHENPLWGLPGKNLGSD